MEEGAPASTSQTTEAAPASTPATAGSMANTAFKSLGDVLMVLPTSTVIVYEVLNPIVTNTGVCSVANKVVTAVLLSLCAFSCAFSAFTDSYIGADGKVRYGIATVRGLVPISGGDDTDGEGRDFSKYRLRLADFAHALFSVIVFAAVALLADANTVACFYPRLMAQQKALVTALPVVIGALASGFFVVFPSTRHGIGYPPMKPAATALASQ
ncbi:protein DMP2 [Lolium perenne]|uniref:protein DMP2 n=1 Tax=Lolium perenne TaxID=4522 RepID=UPI0021F590EC|nr:protein DMP2-like [Lolium perenne]